MEQIRKGMKEQLEEGKDYYEIRLESIGGLGANLCGKMLGELGLKYLDVNSSSFSSYGSEKTGTPVKGYVRYCRKEKEIRVHSPVTEPDLLVIFHGALLSKEEVLEGCRNETAVILALETGKREAVIREIENMKNLKKAGHFYGLEAQRIAMETHSRINVVMLGAALKLMGLPDWSAGERICRDTLGKKYPDALQANLEGIRRGYEETKELVIKKQDLQEKECPEDECRKTENSGISMPIGGLNPDFGNSAAVDLSPSRQGYIPVFDKEKCIHCGLCFSTCPDMVFQFEKGEYRGREWMLNKGLDYYHCKGCLRCTDICPTGALTAELESEHPDKKYFLPDQELLRMPDHYEKTGSDGYVTSESYLTEKRMDGGEV